eukprot:245673_1
MKDCLMNYVCMKPLYGANWKNLSFYIDPINPHDIKTVLSEPYTVWNQPQIAANIEAQMNMGNLQKLSLFEKCKLRINGTLIELIDGNVICTEIPSSTKRSVYKVQNICRAQIENKEYEILVCHELNLKQTLVWPHRVWRGTITKSSQEVHCILIEDVVMRLISCHCCTPSCSFPYNDNPIHDDRQQNEYMIHWFCCKGQIVYNPLFLKYKKQICVSRI